MQYVWKYHLWLETTLIWHNTSGLNGRDHHVGPLSAMATWAQCTMPWWSLQMPLHQKWSMFWNIQFMPKRDPCTKIIWNVFMCFEIRASLHKVMVSCQVSTKPFSEPLLIKHTFECGNVPISITVHPLCWRFGAHLWMEVGTTSWPRQHRSCAYLGPGSTGAVNMLTHAAHELRISWPRQHKSCEHIGPCSTGACTSWPRGNTGALHILDQTEQQLSTSTRQLWGCAHLGPGSTEACCNQSTLLSVRTTAWLTPATKGL